MRAISFAMPDFSHNQYTPLLLTFSTFNISFKSQYDLTRMRSTCCSESSVSFSVIQRSLTNAHDRLIITASSKRSPQKVIPPAWPYHTIQGLVEEFGHWHWSLTEVCSHIECGSARYARNECCQGVELCPRPQSICTIKSSYLFGSKQKIKRRADW